MNPRSDQPAATTLTEREREWLHTMPTWWDVKGRPAATPRKRSRLGELYLREIAVADCIASALRAYRLGLHARDRVSGGLAEPATVWYARAETSLLFAQAELAYLMGPAPR